MYVFYALYYFMTFYIHLWISLTYNKYKYKYIYIGCNWKLWTNFRHHFHISKPEKMCISTCVRKNYSCKLQVKEYCTCMMVLQHILAVLCEMFSIEPILTNGQVQDPSHGLHACQISILYRVLPVGTPKKPCVCSSCWQWRGTSPLHCGCLSDYLQLHQHLWLDAVVHNETCCGMHLISWRTFWLLIINVL
jgi:hypothetical protein